VFSRDASDGNFMSPPRVVCWVNAFKIQLTGPMAKYYDIMYTGRFIKAGDQAVVRNGDWIKLGGNGGDWLNQPVDAIKVWVVAKQH
jgi:hypothetical protein